MSQIKLKLGEDPILSIDWCDNTLLVGDESGKRFVVDPRATEEDVFVLEAHYDKLCGLKMKTETPYFATASSDTIVKIWDFRQTYSLVQEYEEHNAAVKAISWSPFSSGAILSGGGTADKTLRMWNPQTKETLNMIDTGSQVCNVFWNREYNELISSHGYSQNNLGLWNGTNLSCLAVFYVHRSRILFMCESPDGTKVAAASPGDGLYIWKILRKKTISLTQSHLMLK
jgi:WD40 repeat protein